MSVLTLTYGARQLDDRQVLRDGIRCEATRLIWNHQVLWFGRKRGESEDKRKKMFICGA